MLQDLPSEILFNIASFLSCRDMSLLRLISRRIRTFCDHPINWRSIKLESENPNFLLWRLADLKQVLSPHVSHIRSIQIWGVRDNIIHYLLSQCKNLRHLRVYGWTTLSEHSFKPVMQQLKLESLELIGTPCQANYISMDASTLGSLMLQSPDMKTVLFGCDVHIHADSFLTELENAAPTEDMIHLQSFTLATRRTWLEDHVIRLARLYPTIQHICLMSMVANKESQLKPFQGHGEDAALDFWNLENLKLVLAGEFVPSGSITDSLLISTENMIMYNRNLLHK